MGDGLLLYAGILGRSKVAAAVFECTVFLILMCHGSGLFLV